MNIERIRRAEKFTSRRAAVLQDLSGTKVRDMLASAQRPPQEFSRPEVADVLIKWATAAKT